MSSEADLQQLGVLKCERLVGLRFLKLAKGALHLASFNFVVGTRTLSVRASGASRAICRVLWILLLRRLLLPVAMLLVAVPAARAADPIMPLSEVRQGMSCTGLSVIKGTTISSFDVEILDVIAPEAGLSGPRILIRVSGPAVDETGIGPGFSGSPVICDGRNAGAISEGLGEYGNHVALATPIEGMLEDRPTAPATARRDPALLRAARPLQTPLTVSGLTGPAQDARGARGQACESPAARGARRPRGRIRTRGPASRRRPVRRHIHWRPRPRRRRNRDLPGRRGHLGVRPSVRGARAARAVPD